MIETNIALTVGSGLFITIISSISTAIPIRVIGVTIGIAFIIMGLTI